VKYDHSLVAHMNKLVIASDDYLKWNGGLEYLAYIVSCMSMADGWSVIVTYNPIHLALASRLGRRKEVDIRLVRLRMLCKLRGALLISRLNSSFWRFVGNAELFGPEHYSLFSIFKLKARDRRFYYVPDLQHIHIPDYFSYFQRFRRSLILRLLIISRQKILVNSEFNKAALSCCGVSPNRITVLPFAPYPPVTEEEGLVFSEELLSSFGLTTTKYIICCNQAWIHKNHLELFEYFDKFAKTTPEWAKVKLVCTGSLSDPRYPLYTRSLHEFVKSSNNIVSVGELERTEQIRLMMSSLLVVQPTTYEGGPGGGSVYDALSYGVPAVLTDIEVNTEIKNTDGKIYFYSCGNFASFQSALSSALQEVNLSKSHSDRFNSRVINCDLQVKRKIVAERVCSTIKELKGRR
jgi:glycosyltransferase involved in cell wall biosynthesis